MKAEPEKKTPDEQSALFSSLVWRLAVETKAFLGERVNPEIEPMEPHPEYAKHIIDTLQMLKEKTEGNRTEPESEMLEAVLYDLRMNFLQADGQGKVSDKSTTENAEEKSEGRSQNSEVRTPEPETGHRAPEHGPSTTEAQSEESPGEDENRK